jgi:hypothetical protein
MLVGVDGRTIYQQLLSAVAPLVVAVVAVAAVAAVAAAAVASLSSPVTAVIE